MNTAELLNDNFRFEISESSNKYHIKLIGIIDENADLSSLVSCKNKPIVFNFKEVSSVNSCGIRTWVNFMKELNNSSIEFVDCPPTIVRQMNMVPSFLGKANVISVYVPYVCDACEHEHQELTQIKDYKSGTPVAESLKCPNCSSEEMEIDGNVKQYFAFVK